MFEKIKDWLFEGVIVKKVLGKFIKHAIGILATFVASKPYLVDAGIDVNWEKFETWATVVLAGLFGAAWNYIDHRFVNKT